MGTGTIKVPVPGIFHLFCGVGTGIGKIDTGKSLGTSIGKIWYRKKSRNRYRKDLVPKKVPVLVSKILGTGNNYWYRLTFLGTVTH